MQNVDWSLSSAAPVGDGGVLRVAIAYEEVTSARRALKLYEKLVERLSPGFHFRQSLWKTDALAHRPLFEAAAKELEAAEMIIVSLSGSKMPVEICDWLQLTAARRAGRPALVVLLENSPEQPETLELRRFLAEAASRWRVELFIHCAQSAEPAASGAAGWTFAGQWDRKLSPLHQRPFGQAHWGINE